MRKTLIGIVLMVAAAVPAFAAESNTLMIFSFHPGGTLGFTGSFKALGVIYEAATAESNVQWDPAVSEVLTANKTIYLAAGKIYMTMQGRLNTDHFPDVWLTGTWHFTGGTGAYDGIRGRGTCAVVGDFGAGTFSGAYQGKVKLPDEGDDD